MLGIKDTWDEDGVKNLMLVSEWEYTFYIKVRKMFNRNEGFV